MSGKLLGILVVDKPQGPTSFDVVRRVRAALKIKKAGHTGTLDPMATGLLPICIEEATRVQSYITDGDKAYQAVLKLGAETDTLDAEGKVVSEAPVPALTAERIESVLAPLRGPQMQTPPMFSAVRIDGKRMYELAREGEEVERPARAVEVFELKLLDFSADEIRFEVHASKGFFVRVLGQQIGQALGCGGHLKALRRVRTGPFRLQHAVTMEWLEARVAEGPEALMAAVSEKLVSENEALGELPELRVGADDAKRVSHGVPLESRVEGGKIRIVDESGRLLAIAEANPPNRLKYLRVLA